MKYECDCIKRWNQSHREKIVIIQIGINDLTAIAFLPEHTEKIVKIVKQNIFNLLKRLREEKIHVYIMTIIPPSESTGLWTIFWTSKTDQAVAVINQFIKKLGDTQITVVDVAKQLTNNGKLESEYSLDTLHMNNKGYKVLNDIFNTSLNDKNSETMDGSR